MCLPHENRTHSKCFLVDVLQRMLYLINDWEIFIYKRSRLSRSILSLSLESFAAAWYFWPWAMMSMTTPYSDHQSVNWSLKRSITLAISSQRNFGLDISCKWQSEKLGPTPRLNGFQSDIFTRLMCCAIIECAKREDTTATCYYASSLDGPKQPTIVMAFYL